MKKTTLLFLSILSAALFFSCSDDDKNNAPVQTCYPTHIEMKVNGEFIEMDAMGRGIMLTQNGYVLDLNFGHYKSDPTKEVTIYIELPYQKTGKNLLTDFNFRYYFGDEYFTADINQGDVISEVISNTNKCFYMIFTATLTKNNKTYQITDGIVKYTYEEPFD